MTLRTGEQYSGIYSSASVQPGEVTYTLKMVKRLDPGSDQLVGGSSEASEQYVAREDDDHTMTFIQMDVVDLAVPNVTVAPAAPKAKKGISSDVARKNWLTELGNVPGFRTDADISGNLEGGERTLTPWLDDSDPTKPQTTFTTSSIGNWDQFKENEQRFGLKSDYKEEIYTTAIDTSHPLYTQRAAAAERTAKEIDADRARIDWSSVGDDGMDEEDKYAASSETQGVTDSIQICWRQAELPTVGFRTTQHLHTPGSSTSNGASEPGRAACRPCDHLFATCSARSVFEELDARTNNDCSAAAKGGFS